MCTPTKAATLPLLWSLAQGLGKDPAAWPQHTSPEATLGSAKRPLGKMEVFLLLP